MKGKNGDAVMSSRGVSCISSQTVGDVGAKQSSL